MKNASLWCCFVSLLNGKVAQRRKWWEHLAYKTQNCKTLEIVPAKAMNRVVWNTVFPFLCVIEAQSDDNVYDDVDDGDDDDNDGDDDDDDDEDDDDGDNDDDDDDDDDNDVDDDNDDDNDDDDDDDDGDVDDDNDDDDDDDDDEK